MTTDLLEAQIRTSLEGWAARVEVAAPAPLAGPVPPTSLSALAVAPRHWRKRPLVLAGGLIALVAVVATLVASPGGTRVRVAGGQPGAGAGAGSGTATPGGAPLIVLADPAWQVDYFTTGPAGPGPTYTEYHFSGPASGYLQISFYPTDSRTGPISSFPPTPSATSSAGGVVDVRGTQGAVTNEGPPRWRIDWDEAAWQWEADGTPFNGAQGLAEFLSKVQVVDTGAWQAQMPAGLVDDIRTHSTDDVTWYRGQDITCLNPDAEVSPSGTVTQTPCSAAPATGPAPSPAPVTAVPSPVSLQGLPYCGGKLDLCFATMREVSDYATQGMILSTDNGHATFAPIVVPTDTVRPATPVPTPG